MHKYKLFALITKKNSINICGFREFYKQRHRKSTIQRGFKFLERITFVSLQIIKLLKI